MDPSIDPPAIVKAACSLKERGLRIKSLHLEHVTSSLEKAIAIGAELQAAKDQCVSEGRGWLQWLSEIRYPARTASRHIRAFHNKDNLGALSANLAGLGVAESLELLAGPDEPDPPEPKQQPLFGKELLLCRAHRTGQKDPDPDCKDCLALQAPNNPFTPSQGGQPILPQTTAATSEAAGTPGPTETPEDWLKTWKKFVERRHTACIGGLIAVGESLVCADYPEWKKARGTLEQAKKDLDALQRRIEGAAA